MAERIVQLAVKGFTVVSCVFALTLMGLITADVVMRFFFNSPIPSVLEISEGILMPYIVFGAIAAADHVKVTLVLPHLPPRIRRVVIAFSYLVSILFFAVMDWQSVASLVDSIQSGETSPAYFGFPIYVGRFAVVIGVTLLILVLLVKLGTTVREKESVVEARQLD